jgi:NADPH:quinone reductase-like Zn-dependent oxidoreductase
MPFAMSSTTFKQYWLPEKKGSDSRKLRTVPKESPQLGQILVPIKSLSLNWRNGIVAIGTCPFPGPDARVSGSDSAGT